jgi:hypothetical protein
MKRNVIASLAAILAGCSFAPAIQSDSIDYSATLEAVSNQLLVTNILRARDHAPLHFANLSALRAQFQANASLGVAFPLGPNNHTTARGLTTDVLSLQTAPSFDFAPLDTEQFTRGILSPVDPQVVKYYFDRALPQELLVFLFFDRISPGKPSFLPFPDATASERVTSLPPDQQDLINDPSRPKKLKEFATWVKGIFGAYRENRVIVANSYLRQIGPPIEGNASEDAPSRNEGKRGGDETGGPASLLKDLSSIDPSKVRVECLDTSGGAPKSLGERHCSSSTTKYKLVLYAEPPDVIFCAKEQYFYVPLALATPDMNNPQIAKGYEHEANLWKELCTSRVAPGTTEEQVGTIYIRSVEGMIQYLGSLIEGRHAKEDQSILRQALGGYTLFDLETAPEGASFGVSYGGDSYYVHYYDRQRDRTMLTLALVNQLINLNTNAAELPTTKPVEIVP